VENAKKHGKSSDFGGEFATLPICQHTQGGFISEVKFPKIRHVVPPIETFHSQKTSKA
jgi:hypothetical protein